MSTSQNGWPVDPPRTARTIPGTGTRVSVADGPAGDVLMYVLAQFDKRVEDIDMRSTRGELDDWGYASRPIRGGTTTSNHASATAVDVNATRHPLGAAGTFTPGQVGEIHRILAEVDHVVRWGGDYSGRKDEMHFEIVGTLDQVAAVVNKLRKADTMSFTPNEFLMAGANHHYPTDASAKAAGLPVVGGKQVRVESHPFVEWFTVHCIRQGLILAEAQRQTALLTEIRDALKGSA